MACEIQVCPIEIKGPVVPGEVTSGSMSPCLKKNISIGSGLASVCLLGFLAAKYR